MVRHEIWQWHGSGKRMLCIGCLEKRLGRELTSQDFLPCILTNMICARMQPASSRLLDRLRDYAPSKKELEEFENYFLGHLPPEERQSSSK